MVIGILPDTATVQTLLNNLEEADFGPHDISVAMKDKESVTGIADVSGSLTGAFDSTVESKLESLGVPGADIAEYKNVVLSGGVFIAVSAEGSVEAAAKEMLQDGNVNQIRTIKNK